MKLTVNQISFKGRPFDRMNYGVWVPDKAGDTADLPLIVYLHGAGERGLVFDHILRHGLPLAIRQGREVEAVILCPQCPACAVWDNIPDAVKAIIDKVATQYRTRPDRITLTGSSMGGFGTWMMGMNYPSLFAGIAPIAGGGMVWRVGNLRTTPVYTMVGDRDDCVPPENTVRMAEALESGGGHVTLRLLNGWGHNDGIDEAYLHTDLIAWLLEQRRADFSAPPEFCSEWF